MAGYNKTRTTPFRILAYLLYGKYDWITRPSAGVVKLATGPASRSLRIRSADFWEHLYWLEQQCLVEKVEKLQKRGTVTIRLSLPLAYDQLRHQEALDTDE